MAQIGDSPVLTTTEAVRGALGIDHTDIPDQTILNAELDAELSLDLPLWLTNWEAKIEPPQDPTPEQKRLSTAIKQYCKWWCAAEFAAKFMAHIQQYSDGKAQMRRFTNFELDTLVANAAGKVALYRDMILELDPESVVPDTATFVLISGGIPTHNPVTNEGARE